MRLPESWITVGSPKPWTP